MINYFDLLGIPITDDENIIKKAGAKATRDNPPTKDVEKFYEIQKALKILLDFEERANYIAKISISGDIDEILELAYENLKEENYLEVKKLINQLNGYEDESIIFLKANLLFQQEFYEKAIEKYDELITSYGDENGTYQNRKLFSLIKLECCDSIEKELIKFTGKYNYISTACSEYIDFNIRMKEYDRNKIFIKLSLYKFNNSLKEKGKCCLEYFNLKNSIYQCDFSNFKNKVEKLVVNSLEIEEETRNYIIGEINYLSELLIDWEQPREYAIIQLYLEKYIRENDENESILKFIDLCEEYESAIRNGVDEDFLWDVYLYMNKFKLEQLEDQEKIKNKAYGKQNKYIDDNPIKVNESLSILKNKYKLIYSFISGE